MTCEGGSRERVVIVRDLLPCLLPLPAAKPPVIRQENQSITILKAFVASQLFRMSLRSFAWGSGNLNPRGPPPRDDFVDTAVYADTYPLVTEGTVSRSSERDHKVARATLSWRILGALYDPSTTVPDRCE